MKLCFATTIDVKSIMALY